MSSIDFGHIGAAVLAVAHPRKGDKEPQSFVFWISILIILGALLLAWNGKLTNEGAVFATGSALVIGYWLRGETEKVKK